MKRFTLTLGLLITACSVLSFGPIVPARADTFIHIPGDNGAMGSFWGPERPSFGELFKAPSDDTLDSFAFHDITAMSDHYFKGYVVAWDGSEPTGPVLYESGVQHLRASDIVAHPYDNPFDTGGIQLVAAQEYIAFLSVSGVPGNSAGGLGDVSLGNYDFGTGPNPAANPYPDGAFVWEEASNSGSEWVKVDSTQAQFDARFSPSSAPEPGSLALLAIGGLPLCGVLRLRIAVGKRTG